MSVGTRRQRRVGRALLGTSLVALVLSSPVQAGFPGANGRIAYKSGTDQIRTVAPLSGSTALTPAGSQEENPAWSPDGKKIAFVKRDSPCGQEIWTMNADGTGKAALVTAVPGFGPCSAVDNPSWNRTGSRIAFEVIGPGGGNIARADTSGLNANVAVVVTSTTADERDPAYAPNSDKIAFDRKIGAGKYTLNTVNDDGTSLATLLSDASHDLRQPNWSPDGAKLVYQYLFAAGPPADWDIYTVNANGTGATAVVANHPNTDWEPAWSPEGNNIVYTHEVSSGGDFELYTRNPDGTGGQIVLESRPSTVESEPDWQPVVAAQVRPRGATPLFMPLVPAFNDCTSANATHDAPLSYPSCVPPKASSSNLTVGEPSVNGNPANFVGSFKLKAIPGDASLAVSVTDVRCAHTLEGYCTGGPLSDYTGTLTPAFAFRLTDRSNPGPNSAGTVVDLQIPPEGAFCNSTANPTFGSICSVSFTLNGIIPGMIVQGRRQISRFLDFKLLDPFDNSDFAVPGTFFP